MSTTTILQAVGEPPFFMASSAFFAIKDAVASARKDHGEAGYFRLNSPASSERYDRTRRHTLLIFSTLFLFGVGE